MSPFEQKTTRRIVESLHASTVTGERADRLHVAVVTDTYPPELNGVALSLQRAVEFLRARGHNVQVFRPRQAGDGGAQTHNDDVLLPGMGLPAYPGVQFGFPAKKRLKQYWGAQRPNVVHVATEGPLGWSALHAARALAIPVTSDYRTHFQRYSSHYGVGWMAHIIGAYLRAFHNRAHMTFVSTSALQGELEARGYRNVARIGRGIDTELFNPQRRSSELRARWGLAENDIAVIHVGRLAPEKNLQLAVRAYDRIREVCPTARMIWVGDGPSRSRLQQACPHHIFAGMQRGIDLAAHYASGDLFLFPSLTETFGNVTLEALASGLALVAFNEGAAAQHTVNNVSARLVPPEDEAAFIGSAVELASARALLARLKAEAPRAVSALSWPAVLAGFESHLLASAHGYRLYANALAAA
jgi:glycosyltransferase involved in cell wall biosynthesis